jgi:hypothetical protein
MLALHLSWLEHAAGLWESMRVRYCKVFDECMQGKGVRAGYTDGRRLSD